MKASLVPVLVFAMLISPLVRADDLAPATSDDGKKFDQQLSQHQPDKSKLDDGDAAADAKDAKKPKKDNFGSLVSAEAKKMKAEDKDKKKEFGKWVSSQRRKNDQSRPDPANPDKGAAEDHHSGSQPGPDDRGGSNGGGTSAPTTGTAPAPTTGHGGHGH